MADDNVPIKGIEYEIKGNADKAVKGIDALRTSLSGLKKVAKGGTGLGKVAQEVEDFGTQAKESERSFEAVASGMNSAEKAATSLAQKIMGMKSAWKDLAPYASKASKDMREFGQIVKSDFGGVFSNLKEIIGESLSGVGEKISGAFGNVREKLQPIADAVRPVFSEIAETAKYTFATFAQPIVAAGQKLAPVFDGAFNAIKTGLQALPKVAGTVASVVAKVLKTIATAALSVAKAIGSVLVKAFKAAFNAIKSIVTSIIQLPGKIKDSILKSFENLKEKIADVGAKAKEWFNNSIFTKPLRDAAAGAGEFAKKLANVGNSLKRILFYRVIRTVIKEIGDAFKTGINNLYAWSAAIGGEFAASMDRMATSMQYFKNSIGAAVAPLINALAPALDFVIDKVVSLLNVINQLFARLTGASYWTRAIKQASNYGDAASSAGGAAKEAMKYLAPFDELNVLPSDSGGGGGGGAGGASGGGMFEEMVSFNEEIKDFADRLKEAFNAGDWEGVGDVISEKLNDIIENRIPWDSLGQKFGYWVNAIVSMEYWTLEKTHFDSLGEGIAEFINNALEQIDFNIWGRLITRKLTAALDFAIGLFVNLDTTTIGKSIHDFFIGMFDEWSEWFDKWDWGDLANIAYNKLKGLFDGLSFSEIASSALTALGKAFGSASKFLGTFFGDLGKDIKDWFDANLKGQTWSETANNILTWIGNGFKGIATWVDTNFITPFMDALGVGDKWSDLKSVGTTILEKIKADYSTVVSWANTKVISPIKEALRTGNWDGVFSGENGVLSSLKEGYEGIRAWVITNVINPIGKVLFGDNWKNISPNGQTLIEKFTDFLGNVKDWVQENIIDPITEKLTDSTLWQGIFDSVASVVKQSLHDAFNKVSINLFDFLFGEGSAKWVSQHPNVAQLLFGSDWEDDLKIFLEVEADVTSATDKIPASEKEFDHFTGNIENTHDLITSAKRKITDMTAEFTDRTASSKNGFNSTIGDMTAEFTRRTALSKNGFNFTISNMLAEFTRRTALSKNGFNSTIGGMTAEFVRKIKSAGFDSTITGMTAKVTDITVTEQAKANLKARIQSSLKLAEGGVFVNGHLSPIQAFASGGSPFGGQLFVAREAGPELVGTLKGHTAVMNNDQIVASVSAGVARAISGIQFHMTGIPMATVPTYDQGDDTEEMMYRAFMRAISESDFTFEDDINIEMDGEIAYQGVVRRNKQATRRTGVNPLMA